MKFFTFSVALLTVVFLGGCEAEGLGNGPDAPPIGPIHSTGGVSHSTGGTSTAGVTATGGTTSTAGVTATGGRVTTGGAAPGGQPSGGTPATGGSKSDASVPCEMPSGYLPFAPSSTTYRWVTGTVDCTISDPKLASISAPYTSPCAELIAGSASSDGNHCCVPLNTDPATASSLPFAEGYISSDSGTMTIAYRASAHANPFCAPSTQSGPGVALCSNASGKFIGWACSKG